MANEQPTPLTPDARAALAVFFETMAVELTTISTTIESVKVNFPALLSTLLYRNLRISTTDAIEQARELADYLRIATDENWQAGAPESGVDNG